MKRLKATIDVVIVILVLATFVCLFGYGESMAKLYESSVHALRASVQVKPDDSPVGLKIAKDVAATAQSIATIIALLVGAWWVFKKRRNYPRAKFTHTVNHVALGEDLVLVHVGVLVENVGDVLLRVGPSWACVQQVSPFPAAHRKRLASGEDLLAAGASEADWPLLKKCDRNWAGYEIEPGESGAFNFELPIPATMETVLVYTFFRNMAKPAREIGWNTTSVHSLTGVSPDKFGLTKGVYDGYRI
jgi:hypothetical protein